MIRRFIQCTHCGCTDFEVVFNSVMGHADLTCNCCGMVTALGFADKGKKHWFGVNGLHTEKCFDDTYYDYIDYSQACKAVQADDKERVSDEYYT